jgi:predicted phosphodiesterase
MRIAVMADVHGFDLALESVLEDIEARGGLDAVVVAGDLCLVGPAPGRSLQLLEATGFTLLRGNTDQYLVDAARGAWQSDEMDFALAQLGRAGVATLAALPFERRITPPGESDASRDLLIVHANPHNLETKLTHEMDDDQIRDVLGDTRAAAIAFGHHHIAFTRVVDGTLLVDVSAVGNPKDGDLRCKYGIFTWDRTVREWTAEIVRIDYPLEETLDEMRQSGMPDAKDVIRRLLQASY